jgi:hypothetical protein
MMMNASQLENTSTQYGIAYAAVDYRQSKEVIPEVIPAIAQSLLD